MANLISTVLAAKSDNVDGVASLSGVATLKGLENIFDSVISIVLGFGGVVLFIMLIVGGFQFITAGGEPPKIEQARKTLTYAITGIVLLALAFIILRFISNFTGVDVTQFKIIQGD